MGKLISVTSYQLKCFNIIFNIKLHQEFHLSWLWRNRLIIIMKNWCIHCILTELWKSPAQCMQLGKNSSQMGRMHRQLNYWWWKPQLKTAFLWRMEKNILQEVRSFLFLRVGSSAAAFHQFCLTLGGLIFSLCVPSLHSKVANCKLSELWTFNKIKLCAH